jgi:hypothetical protein
MQGFWIKAENGLFVIVLLMLASNLHLWVGITRQGLRTKVLTTNFKNSAKALLRASKTTRMLCVTLGFSPESFRF